MYADTVRALGDQAVAKLTAQRRSPAGHFVRSMLAGMYVGAAIVLIFTIGGLLSKAAPGMERLAMGICFGGALTIVIFAGSELFTGSNLVLTLGVLTRRAAAADLPPTGCGPGSATWPAASCSRRWWSSPASSTPTRSGRSCSKLAATKMTLPPGQLFFRAVLANWLVCLGVWMAARVTSETARILLIWWCMFTFITSGYEHSIANMCGLMLGLLLPHGEAVTWNGYWYNLGLATLGNIVGGAVFVAGVYWFGSPTARAEVRERLARLEASANGAAEPAAAGLALAPEAD